MHPPSPSRPPDLQELERLFPTEIAADGSKAKILKSKVRPGSGGSEGGQGVSGMAWPVAGLN